MVAVMAPVNIMPLSEQVEHVACLRAQGKTWREIQTATGLCQGTIANRLRDDEAKAILEDATKHHIRSLPVALARHDELVASDDEAIALKAIESRYKITGILPAHTQSVYIDKLLVQTSNSLEDAQFRSLAMSFLGLSDPTTQAITAEIVSDEE